MHINTKTTHKFKHDGHVRSCSVASPCVAVHDAALLESPRAIRVRDLGARSDRRTEPFHDGVHVLLGWFLVAESPVSLRDRTPALVLGCAGPVVGRPGSLLSARHTRIRCFCACVRMLGRHATGRQLPGDHTHIAPPMHGSLFARA